MTQRTALVTGGNRGIGFQICRGLGRQGLGVVVAARDQKEGRQAAAQLTGEGIKATTYPLDVADPASIETCRSLLEKDGIAIDVLINNAGMFSNEKALAAPLAEIDQIWRVNTRGPWLVCQAFVPAMMERGYGRIVNVSSGYGSFSEGLAADHAGYAVTKAALDAFTVCLAKTLKGDVKANAMCPGWVHTRMGGPDAPRTPEQGADTAVWLATLPADGPNGGFFRDRKPIEW